LAKGWKTVPDWTSGRSTKLNGPRVVVAALLAVGAVLVDRSVLERFAADGAIESTWIVAAIRIVQAVLLTAAAVALLGLERRVLTFLGRSRLALLTASVLLALALAEGLVRVVLGPVGTWAPPNPVYVGQFENRPSENFVADERLGWRMAPGREFRWIVDGHENVYRANGDGFRSGYEREEVERASREQAVVVVAGDSFAWGTGVDAEQTFAALLDSAMADAVVYNQALPGMGVDQMWMTVRHAGLPLGPRVVVVAFIDNDLDRSLTAFRTTEGMNKPTFMESEGGLRPQTPEDRARTQWLRDRSALWALARTAGRDAAYERPVGRWWSLNAAIFREIGQDAALAGAEMLFVRLPLRDGRPFPQLGRHLDALGHSYLDLGVPTRDGLHFDTDDHINAEGHRYVAEAIAPVLGRLLRDGADGPPAGGSLADPETEPEHAAPGSTTVSASSSYLGFRGRRPL
jgi:hypothetical protein